MQGKIWITKRDYRWAKIDAEMISDFNFGVFLAKLHKGMHIQMEQTRINNEVWLPKFVRGNMDARVALHTARLDFETTYSNYKKFGTSIKITFEGQDITSNAQQPPAGKAPAGQPQGQSSTQPPTQSPNQTPPAPHP